MQAVLRASPSLHRKAAGPARTQPALPTTDLAFSICPTTTAAASSPLFSRAKSMQGSEAMQFPAPAPRRTVVAHAGAAPAQGSGLLESSGQQVAGYTLLAAVYTVLGTAMTVAPGWALQVGLRVQPTELYIGLMGVFASYFWMVVGVLVCLREAAIHNRLSSDTYKRLNLGIMYWAVTMIVMQLRFQSVSNPALITGYVVVGLLTALVCGRSYSWSNGGFSLPDIVSGLVAGVKDFFAPKTFAAGVYSVLGLIYLACWVLLFPTDAHPLFLGDIGATGQYLKRKLGAGMLIGGVVHYVLKDAADRGRLGASTFRQLNLAVSLYSVVGGYYFYRMWSSGVPMLPWMYYALMAMSVVTVAFCDFQFFTAKK